MAEPKGRCSSCTRYRRLWFRDWPEIQPTGDHYCAECIGVVLVIADEATR